MPRRTTEDKRATSKTNRINPPQTPKECEEYQKMLYMLRLHGLVTIPFPRGRKNEHIRLYGHQMNRQYRVSLFHHHLLDLQKAMHLPVWLNQHLSSQPDVDFVDAWDQRGGKEEAAVVQHAIRAIYALGLNAGTVLLGADSPTRIKVMDVLPFQALDEGQRQKCDAAMEQARLVLEMPPSLPRQLLIGADIEFALRDPEGNMGIASTFLEPVGIVGCDSARLRTEHTYTVQQPIVELRPQPGRTPQELMSSLYHAMQMGVKKITDPALEWIAGGMPFPQYPIGGHIHFSGVSLHFGLIRALDAYLCLPLALLEDEGCLKRRPRYGFLGDFREKEHGGFEYRTLPSWLITPEIAAGVLCLSLLIVRNHKFLRYTEPLDLKWQRAYYRGDKKVLHPFILELYEELKLLDEYRLYQLELDRFFCLSFSGISWEAKKDIRQAWHLMPCKMQTG